MSKEKGVRPLLIVKTGEVIDHPKITGDFEDWILAGTGIDPRGAIVRRVDRGEALPEPVSVSGVIVTGSSAMVSERLDWSEATARWLERAVEAETPVLGICFGHQLLAHAFGGVVGPDPSGREIGTVLVRLRAEAVIDPLFASMPALFDAQATHQESVLQLPSSAVELATSRHPANHAFRIGDRAWGVQFHPEFDDGVMESYIEARAGELRKEGLDPRWLWAGVRPSPDAVGILELFAEFISG